MKTLVENNRRKLVQEIGPYMNLRWVIYDNKDIMEVWFSDRQRALDYWEEIKDRETYSEALNRERMNRKLLVGIMSDTDELPW